MDDELDDFETGLIFALTSALESVSLLISDISVQRKADKNYTGVYDIIITANDDAELTELGEIGKTASDAAIASDNFIRLRGVAVSPNKKSVTVTVYNCVTLKL